MDLPKPPLITDHMVRLPCPVSIHCGECRSARSSLSASIPRVPGITRILRVPSLLTEAQYRRIPSSHQSSRIPRLFIERRIPRRRGRYTTRVLREYLSGPRQGKSPIFTRINDSFFFSFDLFVLDILISNGYDLHYHVAFAL